MKRGVCSRLRPGVGWPMVLGLLSACSPAAKAGESDDLRGPTGDSMDQAARRMTLTFDDLPANSFVPTTEAFESVTDVLVSGLVRHGIPAIGFVNEVKLYVDDGLVPARVATLQAWVDAGLELGNHSFSHPDINHTPLDEYQADVLRGEEVTRELPGNERPRFFRHPFLHAGTSLETRSAFEGFLGEHGYRVAPVTIDNQEWIFARAYDHARYRGNDDLAARISDAYLVYMDSVTGYYEAQSRALLGYEIPQVMLLHANQLNADVLDPLVAKLEGRGYEFIPLEEALEDPAYDSPDEYAGTSGITWLHRWALTQGKSGEFFAGEPEAPDFVQEAFADRPPR